MKALPLIAKIVLAVLVLSLPVMWLWNWLMPKIFGLMTLDFWESIGLIVLCNLLFDRFSKGNG